MTVFHDTLEICNTLNPITLSQLKQKSVLTLTFQVAMEVISPSTASSIA